MSLKSRFLPWQPQLVFSGYSYYTIETAYGKIIRQRDVWDAIQDNSSPSVGATQTVKGTDESIVCDSTNFTIWPISWPCFTVHVD